MVYNIFASVLQALMDRIIMKYLKRFRALQCLEFTCTRQKIQIKLFKGELYV